MQWPERCSNSCFLCLQKIKHWVDKRN